MELGRDGGKGKGGKGGKEGMDGGMLVLFLKKALELQMRNS